ncbi:MAG: DEAD/DEAH box helicase, partial [Bacillota bacterium]
MAIHPIKTTEKIKQDYFSYLQTIKPFKEKWLRDEFASAIREPDMLVKGPILEISLPYKKGATLIELVNEGLLSRQFEKLETDELPLDRQLFIHQEKAIRKILDGRSIVIATGTGSGKTEAFLLPILNYLMREEENGTLSKPGVRALLLYPMNALANDQIKRLRRLLNNYPKITFGRYVGETKDRKDEAKEVFALNYPEEQPPLKNELLSREEMQETPPHILLTNYAMLEYLLLRPEDSPLFDGPNGKFWHFIVLDEAHVYDGANATEIAMLIRRLVDRIVQSQHGRLQAIATSATLGGGKEDFPLIAKFAMDLFNQSIVWDNNNPDLQDVVEAERIPIELGEIWGKGDAGFYGEINRILNEARENDQKNSEGFRKIVDCCRDFKVPADIITSAIKDAKLESDDLTARFLFNILKGDKNVHSILNLLEKSIEGENLDIHANPSLLTEIAKKVFAEDLNRNQTIVDLINLAVFSRKNGEDLPLLPARYHLFVRALEGAFICLNEEAHKEENGIVKKRLFLKRQKYCPHCGSRVFEIANCTRCGTTYLIGDEKTGLDLEESEIKSHQLDPEIDYLIQSSVLYDAVAAAHTNYYLLGKEYHDLNEDELIAGEESAVDINESFEYEPKLLCPDCGQVQNLGPKRCQCSVDLIPIYKIDIGRKKILRRCVSCSTRASGGVIFRFLTSQDAPVSIIADALYQELPAANDRSKKEIPGKGRKMLLFTDSRQNAAFFAPYIERAHNKILRRRVILKTVLEDDQARQGIFGLEDILPRLQHQADRAGLFALNDTPDQQKRRMAVWLMQEFSPLDRRISLEGLGLIRFAPVFPKSWKNPEFLQEEPWELNPEESQILIIHLLNTLRYQGAITYLMSESVDLIKDEEFAPRQKHFYFRHQNSNQKKGIFSWMPSEGYGNARLDYLLRILEKKGFDEKNRKETGLELLNNLGFYLIKNQEIADVFLQIHTIPQEGVAFRINHKFWHIFPDASIDNHWMICDKCLT